MGGDHGPSVVVAALGLVAARLSGVRLLLHGDQVAIAAELARHPAAAAVCDVRHTDKTVDASDEPHQALRRGQGSSLWNRLDSLRSGEIKAGSLSGPFAALGGLFASRALARLRAQFDPGRSNGAPLLGLTAW